MVSVELPLVHRRRFERLHHALDLARGCMPIDVVVELAHDRKIGV
jgi:hypothetical protein